MTTQLSTTPALISENAPLRAVIYTRISLARDGNTLGVARQQAVCRELAARNPWTVTRVFEDNNKSASRRNGKRPEYKALLESIERGEVDIVISWAQDRLLRQPLELESLINLADKHPFIIAHSVDMWTDLTTASGREMARYHVARSRGEMERKSERQKAAYKQSATDGKPPNGTAFGYLRNGDIVADEAAMVRDMFTRFVAGEGIKTITDDLNSRGILNTKGKPWSRFGVRWMLLNPRYIGERWKQTWIDGKLTHEFVTKETTWEPIVPEELFRAAQAILDDPARTTTPGPNRRWLGSGLYFCGECGARCQLFYQNYKVKSGEMRQGRRYRCGKSFHLLRKADDIDILVKEEVVEFLRKNDLGKLMKQDMDSVEARKLNDDMKKLHDNIDQIKRDYADQLINVRDRNDAIERNEIKLNALDKKMVKYGERSAIALVAGKKDPGAAWLGLDIRSQAKVVDAIGGIILLPGKPGRAPFNPASVILEFDIQSAGE